MIEKAQKAIYFLIFLLLPVQLGKHFWPDFTKVNGIRVDYLSPTLYLTDIAIIILAFLYAYNNHKEIISLLKKNTIFQLCLILLLIIFLYSALFSTSPLAALYGIVKLLELAFLGFFISRISQALTLRFIAWAIYITIPVLSSIAFLQLVFQASLGGFFYFLGERTFSSATPAIATILINGEPFLRPYATFPHPNVFSFFSLFSLIVLLESNQPKAINNTRLKYILASLIIAIILLTFSKITTFIALLYIILRIYQKKILQKWRIPIIGLLIVMIIFFTNQFYSIERVQKEMYQRVELLTIGYNIWKTSPLFGVGLKNFFFHEIEYQNNFSTILLQPIHNIYAMVLVEAGAAGFLLFVLLFTATFKRLLKLYRTSPEARGVRLSILLLFSVCIIGFFDHYLITLQQGQLMLAIILGLSWATDG